MEYALAESPRLVAPCDSSSPTVLLLSGWTPGPMNFLRNKIQSEFDCEIIEPQLRMPPWRGLWCADVNFLLMLLPCLGVVWALWKILFVFDTHGYIQLQIILVSLLVTCGCVWIRLMVAVVARSSISHGVELCLKEMRRRNVVLLVGFSWGAGILSELLTLDTGLDTLPAFLLIAPVSSATGLVAMRDDAALRIQLTSVDIVHVVHASDDPFFCPHPERWESLAAAKTYTLHDVHIFKQPSSRRALAEIASDLIRLKTDTLEP